jgi:hypothetical protein
MKSNNLVGQRFGQLVVIKRLPRCVFPNGKTMSVWECECDCGKLVTLRTCSLTGKTRKTQSCGCFRSQHMSELKWKGCGEIGSTYWSKIINGAKTRSLEFTISIEHAWQLFLEQNQRCALSGVPIAFAPRGKVRETYNRTASLDRIDSLKRSRKCRVDSYRY